MEILSRQEACVGDIAETMGEQISTISERLRRLRDAGLVVSRRQGKHRFYSVADSHITELVLNSLSHATEDEI
jgi:ArsR family transcriptional regulator, lead/cadmium/zinc/bismuth-responsive transcriptional repressor